MRFLFIWVILGLGSGPLAMAELDPGSALLLGAAPVETPAKDAAPPEMSRYQVRPKKEAPTPMRRTLSVEPAEPLPTEAKEAPVQPEIVQNPQVKVLPVEPVESGDPILEISIGPGFVYTNSESSFAYRDFTSAAPVLGADANVWLNTGFALHAAYMTTFSGSVADSRDGSRDVKATQEWFAAGIKTRKKFGRGALMTFGLDYSDSVFKVPSEAVERNKLSSKGARISLDAELPSSPYYSWLFGFVFLPKMSHTEEKTSSQFESGSGVEANAVGLSLGGRINFEKRDSMYWKISYTVEKDQFNGQATAVDPVTNVKPSGVSVVSGTALLQFGYTWAH